MKNLKKVLALVLVFASLLGLATMASATTSDDYSDAANITHIEAVDVMSTIGVFDGISGAFSGDSILTREQAAKIITYMVLGKDDADALVASVAPYTDVARDRWSAGSIAYCKSAGILAGVGNGRFEPNGKLTGVAFAKMCLVALGYDPDAENLTGAEWAVNTSKLAIADAGITDSLSQASLADEMSREDACQMAFNTLKADLVDYDYRGGNLTINGAALSMGASKAKPVATETNWAGAGTNKGISDDGIKQFAEKYFTNLKKEDTNDSFGRPSTTWSFKSDEIGTYNKNSQQVKVWTAKAPKGEMYNAIGSTAYNKMYTDDDDTHVYKLNIYVDGVNVNDDINNKDDYFKKNSTAAAGIEGVSGSGDNEKIGMSGNGVKTELYMNNDGKVTVVMINTYLAKATSDYNTVTGRVNIEAALDDYDFLPSYISSDDFDVSGIKDGDYLLVEVSFDHNNWGNRSDCKVRNLYTAGIQTGTVTEYTDTEDVTVGGTKYTYNNILNDEEKSEMFALNSDATLILDTYGYIMLVDDAFTSSNFVYIRAFNDASRFGNNPVADAYFTDGTNAEISLSRVSMYRNEKWESFNKNQIVNSNGVPQNGIEPGWYTYSGSSGNLYTLRDIDTSRYDEVASMDAYSSSGDTTIIKNGSVQFMSKAKDQNGRDLRNYTRANDKTIFIVRDKDGDVSAYTGVSNVPDVKSVDNSGVAISWLSKEDSEYASYVFIDAFNTESTIEEAGSTADYMFVLKDNKNETHVDGMTYRKYMVVIDGKEEERWVSDQLLNDVDDIGILFKSVKEDSNGRITSAKRVDNDGKQFVPVVNGKIAIERHGSVLDLTYSTSRDAEPVSLIVDSKTNLNLVIGKDGSTRNDLRTEYADGEDYVAYLSTTAGHVASLLDEDAYNVTAGNVFVIKTDDDSEVIDTMWIYVSASTEVD